MSGEVLRTPTVIVRMNICSCSLAAGSVCGWEGEGGMCVCVGCVVVLSLAQSL